jgi:hypothetical protein
MPGGVPCSSFRKRGDFVRSPALGSSISRLQGWSLTNKRVAAILRNGRRTARYFGSALGGLTAELHFAHGLYVTLGGSDLSTKRLRGRQLRR